MGLNADRCYRAIQARDPRFDGRFFTGVLTTGIFCRPVCPARTPLKKNVRFFACAAAALEAGLRPCRRCRPETAPGSPSWLGTSATVARALKLIEAGVLVDGNVEDLAGRLGIGERHLRRLFAEQLGSSPKGLETFRRAKLARRLLDATDLAVTEIAHRSGYRSVRQFNAALRSVFGRSPTELRGSTHAARTTGGTR